jgi:hypothetical protein
MAVAAASSPPKKKVVIPFRDAMVFSDADRSSRDFSIVVAKAASCGAAVPGTLSSETRLFATTRVSDEESDDEPELRVSLSLPAMVAMPCSISVSSSLPEDEESLEPVSGLPEVPEEESLPELLSLLPEDWSDDLPVLSDAELSLPEDESLDPELSLPEVVSGEIEWSLPDDESLDPELSLPEDESLPPESDPPESPPLSSAITPEALKNSTAIRSAAIIFFIMVIYRVPLG